jgi:hypothetical protein
MCNNISERKDSCADISTLQTFSKLICRVAANKEATEPRVLLRKVEVITWLRSITVVTMTWLTCYGISVLHIITDIFHLS